MNINNEQELEREKFSCLIRYLRLSSGSSKMLKKWKKTKGIKYVEWIQLEIDSSRHIK